MNNSPFIEWHLNMISQILMLRERKFCDVSSLREICKILWRHKNCKLIFMTHLSSSWVNITSDLKGELSLLSSSFPPLQQVQIVGPSLCTMSVERTFSFSPHEKEHAPHCFTDLLNTEVDNGFLGFTFCIWTIKEGKLYTREEKVLSW